MTKEGMSAAVELLRKGGTLVSEACTTCGGVQVKYSGKRVCVNCGKEETIALAESKEERKVEATSATGPAEVDDLENMIVSKIQQLLPGLRSEHDLEKQEDIAKLLKLYLDILEKLPTYKECLAPD